MTKMTRCGVASFVVSFLLTGILTQNTTLRQEESTTTIVSTLKTATVSTTSETEPGEQPQGIELEPFKQLAHGVRSGPVVIIDKRTIFVPSLHYDGKGPDAHFWAGNGTEPSENGILVPDENGSVESLSAYNGQSVTIKLPDNLTVDDIDYFGMWCVKFKQNFGHVLTPKGLKNINEHELKQLQGIQIEPFKRLAHGLRSGPIVIVDKKTFFVPNLHYDGKGPDAHFWVGKGEGPSPNGTLVLDEKGSKNALSAYTGQSVYIRLPDRLTIDDVDYFGIWCIQYKHNFGHVVIPKGLKIPPPLTNDNRTVVRLQKCCPIDQVLTLSGCENEDQPFQPTIDVHVHNSTHIDDEPIKDAVFAPFVNHIDCEHRQYPLIPGDDKFILLQNGSLMVFSTHQTLSLDEYCMETIDLGDEAASDWVTTPIVCFGSGEVPTSATFFIVYAAGITISAIFLIITALVFLWIKEVRDARGKCIVGFSLSMAAAFIGLAIAQFSGIDSADVCNLMGFVLQFFLVSSFTWLSMVSWETHYKIRKHDCEAYSKDRRRLIIYSIIGICVPLLTLVISIVVDQIPGLPNTFLKPHFGKNSCWFDQKQGSMLYFYIPIALAISFNILLGVLMKWKLVRFQKHRKTDISWLALKQELKPMFRSCMFLLTLMTLCWLMEIISFAVKSNGGIWIAFDIINSLQGLIIFLIFVLHRPVVNKICRPRRRATVTEEAGRPMKVFSNGGTTDHDGPDDFLINLKRLDSTEGHNNRWRPRSDVLERDQAMNVFNINDTTNVTNASSSNYNDVIRNLRYIDSVDDLR